MEVRLATLEDLDDVLALQRANHRDVADTAPVGRYYVMGQICVAAAHRGRGVFDALYEGHRERYGASFDHVATEIATGNVRSMRAHARVGFRVLETYRDATDAWAIVCRP